MKFEGSGSKGTQVIERKRSVTDGQTARQIDGQGKNNMSPPEGGNIIKNCFVLLLCFSWPWYFLLVIGNFGKKSMNIIFAFANRQVAL